MLPHISVSRPRHLAISLKNQRSSLIFGQNRIFQGISDLGGIPCRWFHRIHAKELGPSRLAVDYFDWFSGEPFLPNIGVMFDAPDGTRSALWTRLFQNSSISRSFATSPFRGSK